MSATEAEIGGHRDGAWLKLRAVPPTEAGTFFDLQLETHTASPENATVQLDVGEVQELVRWCQAFLLTQGLRVLP